MGRTCEAGRGEPRSKGAGLSGGASGESGGAPSGFVVVSSLIIPIFVGIAGLCSVLGSNITNIRWDRGAL